MNSTSFLSALSSPSSKVKTKMFGATGDDHLVAEDANAHARIDVAALVEDCLLVGAAIAVGVFEDEDAIAGGPLAVVAAIVDDVADPDPAAVIDVDVGGIGEHRLGREQCRLHAGRDIETGNGVFRLMRGARRRSRIRKQRGRLAVEHEELNRAPTALLRSAVVQTGGGPKPGVTGG